MAALIDFDDTTRIDEVIGTVKNPGTAKAVVVRRRVALLDRNALGMGIVVFATVNLTQTGRQNLLALEREVETHPEVVECYTMAGIWDYVLKIICKDVRHYEDFVRNTLLSGDLVREMHSHIAVTEIKNTTELPIATQLS